MEAQALVWAVKHFWHYPYDHCDVFTDHEAQQTSQIMSGTPGSGFAYPLLSWQEECQCRRFVT